MDTGLFEKQLNLGADALKSAATGLFWAAVVYACFYKLWVSSVVPFTIPMLEPLDATGFFLKALSISLGDWLGEYNHHTLIKGPIYPLFLALTGSMGISLKLAVDVLYVLASVAFLNAIRITLTNRLGILLAFVLVLFNPVTLSDVWAYPMRMNLYATLVLFYFSSLIALVSIAYRQPSKIPYGWIVLGALSLGLAWNTREESIWLIAGLFPLILVTLWRLKQRQYLAPLLMFWLVIVAVPVFIWHQLASMNEAWYGYRGTVDFKAPQFTRATSAIYSLDTGDQTYTYITKESAGKLRDISPATRELWEAMVDDEGRFNGDPAINGAHASWAIRDTMAFRGYYESFEKSEQAYKRIADDIEQYCEQNSANCRPTYIPGLVVKFGNLKSIPEHTVRGFLNLVSFGDPFRPADLFSSERKRGDVQFQYIVGRLLKMHTGLNHWIESELEFRKVEKKRKSKVLMFHRHYENEFVFLLVIALICAGIFMFRKNEWPRKMIALCLLGGFAAGFGIYLLVSIFAVPNLARLLASAGIPLYLFTGYFLALWIQDLVAGFSGFFRGRSTRTRDSAA